MAKILEAMNREFKNVFVCRACKSKIRADPQKILKGKVRCRKCKKGSFRPLKRKHASFFGVRYCIFGFIRFTCWIVIVQKKKKCKERGMDASLQS